MGLVHHQFLEHFFVMLVRVILARGCIYLILRTRIIWLGLHVRLLMRSLHFLLHCISPLSHLLLVNVI